MIEPKLRFKAFSDELSHHTLMDIIVEKPSNGIMNRQSDKVTAVKHINVIDMYTDDKIHVDELRSKRKLYPHGKNVKKV